jgi:predicted ribosome quality control (RQC) complex YloA/Tae2 family protein
MGGASSLRVKHKIYTSKPPSAQSLFFKSGGPEPLCGSTPEDIIASTLGKGETVAGARMNITLEELRTVAAELEHQLVGGVVQEVRQPTVSRVCLTVRRPGETAYLLVEVRPGFAHVVLTDERGSTQERPPPFAARLRKELLGTRFGSVEMPWPDRVLVLRLARGESQWQLVFEGSGHHPNLFLCDRGGTIMASAVPSSSHRRALGIGDVYEPPSPSPGGEGGAQGRVVGGGACMEEIGVRFRAAEEERERAAVLLRLRGAAASALASVEKTLAKVEEDLERARSAARFRRLGELLKLNLHAVHRGMTSVEVLDYADPAGASVTIPLEPQHDARGNLERLFAKYRKGTRGRPLIEERRRRLVDEGELLRRLVADLAACAEPAEAMSLAATASTSSPALARRTRRTAGERKHGPPAHSPCREFRSSTGRVILVGRGGKDNHALTFQVASPHDLWLHVRGFPGSHVVVPLARGQEADPSTLLEAAHLAVHYSKCPAAGWCEAIWTRRKNVRAVRKGKPGEVMVQGEKSLRFDFDAARIARLLGAGCRYTESR